MRIAFLALMCVLANFTQAGEFAPPRHVQSVELAGTPGKLDHFGYDPVQGRLFVSNQGNSSLDVIDVKAGKLIKQVPAQNRIHGIALDPKSGRIFVGNGEPGECAVIDGRTYEVLQRIPVPKADNVQYDPHSGRVFVGYTALAAIDPDRMILEKELSTPAALRAFRIDPTTPRLFANAVSAEVAVFDPRALTAITSYKLAGVSGNAAMTLDAANRRLFLGCRSEPKLVVLDADSGAEIARLDMPPAIDDMWYDALGKCIYASSGEGELAIVAQKTANEYVRLPGLPTVKLARTCLFDSTLGRIYLGVPGAAPHTPARIDIYETRR